MATGWTRRGAVGRGASAVSAAARIPGGPVRTALELLVESEDARGARADQRFSDLDEAKRACKAEVDRVIRSAIPKVAESIALVRFSSPCEVQPLIAMT